MLIISTISWRKTVSENPKYYRPLDSTDYPRRSSGPLMVLAGSKSFANMSFDDCPVCEDYILELCSNLRTDYCSIMWYATARNFAFGLSGSGRPSGTITTVALTESSTDNSFTDASP